MSVPAPLTAPDGTPPDTCNCNARPLAPAPNAVTNAEVTAAIGEVLRRPVVLPVPAFALRIYLGGFASEVLGSLRVYPQRLLDAGFTWQDTAVADAITAAHAGW